MRIIEAVNNQGHGACSPSYLFIHETANPGASALNHSKLYAGGYKYAVQYVCDWTGDVYHCVPDNRLAYGVGNGNRYGVNLEICHATNASDFARVWDTAIEFAAWYLTSRGWTVANLMSHDECRIRWGGTDHTDPIGYFKKYGKTWADFKAAVSAKMSRPAPEPEPARKVDDLKQITNDGGDVFRVYNKETGEHFYAFKAEADALAKNGWRNEGVAFVAPMGGVKPVYRMYRPGGKHLFTASFAEASALEGSGWEYEGVPFFGKYSGKPVYRLYNKDSGDHLLTTSAGERESVVAGGWADEGIAFYI